MIFRIIYIFFDGHVGYAGECRLNAVFNSRIRSNRGLQLTESQRCGLEHERKLEHPGGVGLSIVFC